MPQASNITVNDATSPTPVAQTFAPSRTDTDFVQYENRVGGIYAGYPKLTMSMKRPTPGTSATNLKLAVKLDVPVMEAAAGATEAGYTPVPKVAFRNTAEALFTLNPLSTLQQRNDLQTMFRGVLSHSHVTGLVADYAVPN